MPIRTRAAKARPSVDVTAILVAHDGDRWLSAALAALAASTQRPARVVLVDTGSTDATPELLRAVEDAQVLTLARTQGFGAAVAAALAAAREAGPATTWVWLLHDDCAPAPTALEALLEQAEQSPRAALLGPKVLDWTDPRLLVEIGLTVDGGGHRETGLERREYDQGQRDAVHPVLAVGTAGALVRWDAYDQVGGLDPALAVFRDDLDLGWKLNAAGHQVVVVPTAVVHHVRAATTGRRQVDAAPGSLAGTDRKNALYVLLAHATRLGLLTLLPRLLVASVLRILALLLTRQVPGARDELLAVVGVLGRPARLRAARRVRRDTRSLPPAALRPLLASGGARVRARFGAFGDWVSGGAAPGTSSALGDPGPEGPDEAVDLTGGGSGSLRRFVRRPGVLLVVGLSLVALLAERSLLSGGDLVGGRLLAPSLGASDLWQAYGASWHPSSVGSNAPAPPYLAVLALLATLLLGKVTLAVDLVLLASMPLAGAAAYAAAGRVVQHRHVRLWAAATWALLPVATGGIATGRLDVAVVQIGLPLLALGAARVLTADSQDRVWRAAWSLGLGLTVVAAFSPLLWLLGGTVLLGGGLLSLFRSGSRRRALAALVATAVPAGLLLPWSLLALTAPGRLLHGPGRLVQDAALLPGRLGPLDVPLLHPGGSGLPPVWITAGLVLAALGGLTRPGRRPLVYAGWAAATVGLAAAVLLPHLSLPVEPGGTAFPVWPGVALQLAGGGLLIAALVGAGGLRTRLAALTFGWRQLVATALVAACAALPVLAAGSWLVRGADGPVQRGGGAALPPFAAAEVGQETGLRVLLLTATASGGARYELTRTGDTRLGAADTAPARDQTLALDAVVADLLTPSGSDAAEALATRAVRYVAIAAGPGADRLGLVLDQQPGLTRRSGGPVLLWRVVGATSRLTVLPQPLVRIATSGARAASRPALRLSPPVALPPVTAGSRLPAGEPGRLLVLAEAADDGWRATVDGRPLVRRTAWGWAQGFVAPAAGGRLELHRSQAGRRVELAVQVLLVLVVLVLAAPGAARRRGLEIDDDDPAGAPADARTTLQESS